ncbi:MAG: O-antigen ligase family protein, partial [Asticcacaulis sp.]
MPAYLDDPIPQAPAPERSGLSLWIFTAEALLTGFCIFMFTNALWAPLFAPDSAGSEESAWLRLLWLPVYGLTLLLVLLRLPMFMRALPAVFISGILIGLCYASLFWSIAPDVTSRRSLALAFTTLFGLYLGARYKGRDLTQIVALTFAILAALSLLVSIG